MKLPNMKVKYSKMVVIELLQNFSLLKAKVDNKYSSFYNNNSIIAL